MKKVTVRIRLALLLLCFFEKTDAQFVLVDSIEFKANTSFYAEKSIRFDNQFTVFKRRHWEGEEFLSQGNKISIENTIIDVSPYDFASSQLIYFDREKMLLCTPYVGTPELNEPGKLRDGYRVISKFKISNENELTLVDSVWINIEDIAVMNDFVLQPKPIVITAALAVEGGGGNCGYNVYDENLKKIGIVEPNLPSSCGVECRIFWSDDEINFIDQDPVQENVFSWCKTDLSIKEKHCTRIYLDSLFHGYTSFVSNNKLYISSWKSTPEGSESFVSEYSHKGQLLNIFSTGNALVNQIGKIGDSIICFASRPNYSEAIILDKSFRLKNKFEISGHKLLLKDKILIYKGNKIFIYEIK